MHKNASGDKFLFSQIARSESRYSDNSSQEQTKVLRRKNSLKIPKEEQNKLSQMLSAELKGEFMKQL